MAAKPKYALHKITNRDKTRTPLNYVQWKGGQYIRTNGSVLASVPAEAETDTPMLMSLDAYKMGLADKDAPDVQFPNTETIIRDAVALQSAAAITVRVDAKLLLELAEALGAKDYRVTLYVPEAREGEVRNAITVKVTEEGPEVGVIMPCKLV